MPDKSLCKAIGIYYPSIVLYTPNRCAIQSQKSFAVVYKQFV